MCVCCAQELYISSFRVAWASGKEVCGVSVCVPVYLLVYLRAYVYLEKAMGVDMKATKMMAMRTTMTMKGTMMVMIVVDGS